MVPRDLLLLLSAVVGAVAAAVDATAAFTAPASPAPHCFLHVKARAGDSCAGIAAVFNLDAAAFRRMNPGVSDCAHLVAGTTYCVADGSGAPASPSPSPPSPSPSPSHSPSPRPSPPSPPSPPTPPTPRQSPITRACRSWHLIAHGDTCGRIETGLGITDSDFRTWNGFINADCTNLWLGYYCCVGV